jgi:uncharacterized protein (DUF697 family)
MPKLTEVTNVWKNIQEIDLRPIREAAEKNIRIAIVGAAGTGRGALANQLRCDPSRSDMKTNTPVLITDPGSSEAISEADLIILVVDAGADDFSQEEELVQTWLTAGIPILVFYNHPNDLQETLALDQWIDWGAARVVYGQVNDPAFLVEEFVPAVMGLLPDRLLSLGRHFPLFRVPITRQMINETCFANAAYALSTGLAEIVPILDLPLNVADIIVLTKAQAFLVFKLGLAVGYSTRWQDYVAEFGSVLGGGFLWRQIARQLVGLIPVWGIVPKVAVAYSGTYVVGQVVLQWYLTGRHITRQQIRELYAGAFARGKAAARGLLARAPRPRLKLKARKELPLPAEIRKCPSCGRDSAVDAQFCQYCGQPLENNATDPKG